MISAPSCLVLESAVLPRSAPRSLPAKSTSDRRDTADADDACSPSRGFALRVIWKML